MLVVGEREKENGTASIRSHKDGDMGAMALTEIIKKLQDESQPPKNL